MVRFVSMSAWGCYCNILCSFVSVKKQALEDDEDLEEDRSEDLDAGELSGSDGEDEDGDGFHNEDEVEEGSKSEEEYSDYDEGSASIQFF